MLYHTSFHLDYMNPINYHVYNIYIDELQLIIVWHVSMNTSLNLLQMIQSRRFFVGAIGLFWVKNISETKKRKKKKNTDTAPYDCIKWGKEYRIVNFQWTFLSHKLIEMKPTVRAGQLRGLSNDS